jgi:hypothetical protein
VIEHAGAGAGVTVTVLLAEALPPLPVQVTLYEVVDWGETEIEPEVAPLVEKLLPVHEVALVDDQVRVEVPPADIEVGFADSVAVGGALQVKVAPVCPPPPEYELMPYTHQLYGWPSVTAVV